MCPVGMQGTMPIYFDNMAVLMRSAKWQYQYSYQHGRGKFQGVTTTDKVIIGNSSLLRMIELGSFRHEYPSSLYNTTFPALKSNKHEQH